MNMRWLLNKRPYPSKLRLSPTEELGVLRLGPRPAWFRPFAEHARVAPRRSRHTWGIIHIHGPWGEPPAWELRRCDSPEDLAWQLDVLFRQHEYEVLDVDGVLNDHFCDGVFYWLPTDPRRLRLPLGVTR